jgi:hypothetical protein
LLESVCAVALVATRSRHAIKNFWIIVLYDYEPSDNTEMVDCCSSRKFIPAFLPKALVKK